MSIRSASLYRSAECLSKLAAHHPSQDKRFAKTKNSFKLRLRATQPPVLPAPPSEPLKLRLVRPSVSRENAERTESGSSGGKRELDDQKGRLSIKLNGERTESGSSGGRRELDETSKGRFTVKLKLPKDYKSSSAGAG